jgi:signal transduction histidine kinase
VSAADSAGRATSASWVGWLLEALARRKPPTILGYALTILAVLAGAAAQQMLPMRAVPFLLFLPVIFTASLILGQGEGLLATLLSAILANYLFLGPARGFSLSLPELVTTFMFVVFASFIVIVSNAVRQVSLDQSNRIARLRALQAAAEASEQALRVSEDALRRMNETLEEQIQARTAELERAREVLDHAQRIEALGELTGGIAHDFNNLLTGMTGGMDLARSRLGQKPISQAEIDQARGYLDIGLDFAGRAGALTARLLAFARRGANAPAVVNLEVLVRDLQRPIRRVVGRDIRANVEVIPDLWPTCVDPSELENALLNLVINARDAMPGGGRFVLRGDNISLDRLEAKTLGLPPGDFVILSAQDTGRGMTPEVAARAFEPFFTTKPSSKGTGLGLSMIYRFARTSGGHAALETRPGEGTTVRIYLPRWREAEDAAV